MTERPSTRMPVLTRTLVVVLAVLALLATGCGDDDDTTTTTTPTVGAESTPAAEPTSPPAAETPTEEPTAPSEEPTPEPTMEDGSSDDPAVDDTATDEQADSIPITYACGNGETGEADAPTPFMEELDDVVNTIDFCEFRGGLVSISFTADCPSGDREVTVEAVDGGVPDIATLDLCENEG